MSRVEKFISEHTRKLTQYGDNYFLWITPDDARKAVEIAREELIEKACDAYCKVCGHYHHTVPTHICRQDCDYYDNFKQSMKDE